MFYVIWGADMVASRLILIEGQAEVFRTNVKSDIFETFGRLACSCPELHSEI